MKSVWREGGEEEKGAGGWGGVGSSYCPLRAGLKIPVKKVREFPFEQHEDLGVHTILPLFGLTQTSKLSVMEGLFVVSLLNFC